MTLHLHGLGHAHPEAEITNRFLEDLDIGTTDAWIVERTGIRSRRTVLDLDYVVRTRNRDVRAAREAQTTSAGELGARAARQALERAGLAASDLGLVVAGSSAPERPTPALAGSVAAALGAEVPVFDLNSACTSFLAQLHWLAALREDAAPRFALLVVPELMTPVVSYDDRATAVLWGDGAAAAIVSLVEPGFATVRGTELASSPAGADKVVVPRAGHFVQEGRQVQVFAIRKTLEGWLRLRDLAEADATGVYPGAPGPERALHFVGHQANLRVLENVCERGEIARDRHHHNVEWFGNTAAASAPSVISQRWEKWTDADDVALVGVGAGLTWASALLRFERAPGGAVATPEGAS
jgi:3-oxoacyl-[acyl-carrier-protein] synthase-3